VTQQNHSQFKELADGAFKEMEAFEVQLQEVPTQTIWFKDILMCLLSALLREYRSLTVGFENCTPLLAWACRNMLELDICTKYVLLKGSNAKDFGDDLLIDGVEIFSSFRDWQKSHAPTSLTPELDQTIANFKSGMAKQGVARNKHLRAQTMAAKVGMGVEFQHVNKWTSKLVHPTAFSVLVPQHEGELELLKPILFGAGVRFGVEAFNEIREYVDKNRAEPLT
jgi:hypothetical protein